MLAVEEHKKWRELCNAALEAKDPYELMQILQELKNALKHEEQVLREFRETMIADKPSSTVANVASNADVSHHRG